MIIRRTVGVSPGTTTIALGGSWCESCIPPQRPIQAGPMIPGYPSNWTEIGLGPAATMGPTNPYASEAELRGIRGGGLGLIPVPYGYQPGVPSGEVVGTYVDSQGRRGCDPQHNEYGEEGHYYDTKLGGNPGFARAMPTDAELATGSNYTPVNSQWIKDASGRMWPLPWMPPNGWDVNAGRAGPQPTPPLSGLRDAVPPAPVASTHEDKMFWIGIVSAGAAVAIAGVSIVSLLRGAR